MHIFYQRAGWGFLLVCGLSRYKCPSQGLAWKCMNMFYSQNLSFKKRPGNATRDGWKIRRSCVLTGWLSFADELNSTDFQNALNHFSFEKNNTWEKKWTLEMGTYHWDRHIGCFRGIYSVRRQVLFCGVCIHLRGRPKKKQK